MTSYPQSYPDRFLLYWILFYIDLCYCQHLPYGLIFEIIKIQSVHATQWPNQFPFNCKNSTQNAPKLIFLSSKIEKKFWGGGTSSPHPTPSAPRSSCLRRSKLSKLVPSALVPRLILFHPGILGC